MPLMIDPSVEAEFEHAMLLMITRLKAPIGTPSGPRIRLPRRKKIGELVMSRMVMVVMVTLRLTPVFTQMAHHQYPRVVCKKIAVTAVTPVTTRMNTGDFCYRLLPLLPFVPPSAHP